MVFVIMVFVEVRMAFIKIIFVNMVFVEIIFAERSSSNGLRHNLFDTIVFVKIVFD